MFVLCGGLRLTSGTLLSSSPFHILWQGLILLKKFFSKDSELKMVDTALVLESVLESTISHMGLSFTSTFILFKMHHRSAHLWPFL